MFTIQDTALLSKYKGVWGFASFAVRDSVAGGKLNGELVLETSIGKCQLGRVNYTLIEIQQADKNGFVGTGYAVNCADSSDRPQVKELTGTYTGPLP